MAMKRASPPSVSQLEPNSLIDQLILQAEAISVDVPAPNGPPRPETGRRAYHAGYGSCPIVCVHLLDPVAHMADVYSHLAKTAPHLNLLVEPHTARDHPSHADKLTVVEQGDEPLLERCTDLVVTIGGDGTILHVSHLFAGGECPAVLSFSMGTLGFLLPFR